MSNVVLVIDMVRGFLEPGHNLYCGDDSREIIPNVIRLLRRERDAGSQVLFVSDHHDPDDLEFQIFPRTLRQGHRRERGHSRSRRQPAPVQHLVAAIQT